MSLYKKRKRVYLKGIVLDVYTFSASGKTRPLYFAAFR